MLKRLESCYRSTLLWLLQGREISEQEALLRARYDALARELVAAELEVIRCQAERDAVQELLNATAASLSSAKIAAEESNRAKTTFLSNMSHEIRTPMTSVLGFADLIAQDDLPFTKQQTYVEKIQRNGRHLLALIDDILELSKIEAGDVVITRSTFSPLDELRLAVDLCRGQAEAKQLYLRLHSDGLTSELMVSDQLRFRQIILNVVSNAVKFTDRGGIDITAALTTRSGEQSLEVNIKDTGCGIAPDHQERLFQPFSQTYLTANRHRAGNGLGLALVRNLARLLGGDAVLTASQVSVGSTFSLRLPLVTTEAVTGLT